MPEDRTTADDERRRLEMELLEKLQDEMRRVSVQDYLRQLLMTLSSMAFQHLGLTPDTREDRDLAQSRLAIDAFDALTGVVASQEDSQEATLYRSTLHQMRLAFVTATGSEGGPAAEEGGVGEGGQAEQPQKETGAGESNEADLTEAEETSPDQEA
ncbi:MAG: DUF1844 domain-containing protein [Thermoleophilia bacterium]|nr:DUF1844 domain-containing protein [Thermoleophilia bacterium]